MTPEHHLMNEVMLYCGEHDYACFHANVGLFYTKDGIPIQTGLPKGFSDLIVFRNDGIACHVETKIKPRKPTKEQVNFILSQRKRGFRAGVAYNLDEAIEIIEGKGNGHEI